MELTEDLCIPTLCIHHGNCSDGFTSAWIVKQKYPNADFYHANYSKPAPDDDELRGKRVIIVDFSYSVDVINHIKTLAKEFVLLDHHKTAKEKGIGDLPGCHLDMHRSGAGMTWDYLFQDKERPALVDHVQDYDLWQFKLDHTRAIMSIVGTTKHKFEEWDRLSGELQYAYADFVKQGNTVLEVEEHHMNEAFNGAYFAKLGDYVNVYAVNCGISRYNSELGNRCAVHPDADFGLVWAVQDGKVRVSLRSLDEKRDVSLVARQFGGGGHRNAAAFSMDSIEEFNNIFQAHPRTIL